MQLSAITLRQILPRTLPRLGLTKKPPLLLGNLSLCPSYISPSLASPGTTFATAMTVEANQAALAELEALEAACRLRNKEHKKNGDKEAEKAGLEELKDIMRRKKELLPPKKKGEKADGKAEQKAQVVKEEAKAFTLKTPKVVAVATASKDSLPD